MLRPQPRSIASFSLGEQGDTSGAIAGAMAHLRVLELHRSADGWELVDGGTKPLAGDGSSQPRAPGLRLKPLAQLFAECLAQDSQLGAAFTGMQEERRD